MTYISIVLLIIIPIQSSILREFLVFWKIEREGIAKKIIIWLRWKCFFLLFPNSSSTYGEIKVRAKNYLPEMFTSPFWQVSNFYNNEVLSGPLIMSALIMKTLIHF